MYPFSVIIFEPVVSANYPPPKRFCQYFILVFKKENSKDTGINFQKKIDKI